MVRRVIEQIAETLFEVFLDGLFVGQELVEPLIQAAMVNLLGDLWEGGEPDWSVALDEPRAALHLYGKSEPRPGRKMGHLTVTGENPRAAAATALALREASTA